MRPTQFKGMSNPVTWLIPLMVCLVFALHHFHVVDFHEADAMDLLFRLRGHKKAHGDIVLVTVDDDSLRTLGTWPWPRRTHAVFIDVLSRFHPRSIFFDVLFLEAGPEPVEDEMLSAAMEKAGNIHLPFFYVTERPFRALFPIEGLRESASGMGYINPSVDSDGRIRRFKAFMKKENDLFFHASVMMAFPPGISEAEKEDWLNKLPLNSSGELWINYPGSMDSFRNVSFQEVMGAAIEHRSERLEELFRDKIVVVGHTATGTSNIDVKPTPFSSHEPGVLVLTSALHTLLSGRTLRSLPAPAHFFILMIFAGLIAATAQKLDPIKGLLVAAGLAVVYFLSGILLFIFAGWILPLAVPVFVIIASYVIALLVKHIEIRIQREIADRELQAAFQIQSTFLPPPFPESEILDVAFECKFTKTVGGDLCHWVNFGDGRFGFCVGDAAGKGIPAAIYMAKCVSDFRSIHKRDLTPGELCSRLNYILTRAGISAMFLTFLYAIVDTNKKKVHFANAGHEFPLFYRAQTKKILFLTGEQEIPLGMFDGVQYASNEFEFEPGDAFLLYSDGVKELRNSKKEEFGTERLVKIFQPLVNKELAANAIIEHILQKMGAFQGDVPAHDDRTLLYAHFRQGNNDLPG